MNNKKGVLSSKEEAELYEDIEPSEKIMREVSLSWDGKNIMIRVPKEICHFLGIDEKNRFKKSFRFIIKENEGNIEKYFDIVDRTKPKRGINDKKKN